MEQNLNELELSRPVTIRMMYELGKGKEYCRELDKHLFIENNCNDSFNLKYEIRKIFMKILRHRHDR